MKVFEKLITVQSPDIDALNHVNNVVYVQWVQDVAEAHWHLVAGDDIRQKYVWVVLKHEIEYKASAVLDDVLLARTWVHHSEGVRSERHVEIYHDLTKKLLVRAKTTWCLLDAHSRKPRKIEDDILDLFHGQ